MQKPTDDQDDYEGITFEVEEEEDDGDGRKVRNKGIYLLPNLFTTAALFSGFYAIIAAMQGRFEPAVIAIFMAAVFDGMDGRVARMTNTQSAFGEQYDSLSDLVSFGVAPPSVWRASMCRSAAWTSVISLAWPVRWQRRSSPAWSGPVLITGFPDVNGSWRLWPH